MSPLVVQSPSAPPSSSTPTVKLRGAARSTSNEQDAGRSQPASQGPDRELAEQLNDNVRIKYVKGIAAPTPVSIPGANIDYR